MTFMANFSNSSIRLAARALRDDVEKMPVSQPQVTTPTGTWKTPGRGPNGESSN